MFGLQTQFGLTLKVKSLFFDGDIVKRELSKKNIKNLSKAGAFVRRRARSSLRRRKRPSRPGTPPSVHSSDNVATLKNILFAYDSANQSVIVGPLALNQVNIGSGGTTRTVPHIHEFGGQVSIHEEQVKLRLGKTITPSQMKRASEQQWRRSDLRRNKKSWKNYRVRQVNYPPRPFMLPALNAEAPNFPSLWTGQFGSAAA